MRADTKKKHKMGKRFAIVIGVAATGVMALGAQTAAATYNTRLTITRERDDPNKGALWHGGLRSGGGRKCVEGRRVVLFKKRPGPDRQLGYDGNPEFHSPPNNWSSWGVTAPTDGRVYAMVTREVGDGFVCRAARSRTMVNGRLPKK